MSEAAISALVEHWRGVRKRTRRVVDCIPADRIEWFPAEGRWTFGDQVRHLAGIERLMYAETVSGRPSAYAGHGSELAQGKDGVVTYMDTLHRESVEIFLGLPESRLEEKCLTPAGTPITVWKWLRAMTEHEAHHRGQLYFMLGLLGLSAPPIYGLTEEEVASRAVKPL